MKTNTLALLLILCTCLGLATSIPLVSPEKKIVQEGDVIYLGKIGPGQTIPFSFDPMVKTGGKFGVGGQCDRVIFLSVPEGWQDTPSKWYADPMLTLLKSAANAPEGKYRAAIMVIDEGGAEEIGNNISLFVEVDVVHDIMDMDVEPLKQTAGAGQPARYQITIRNKGAANDVFDITATGVRDWDFRRSIFVAAGASKTVTYEIVGQEEEGYQATIVAQSANKSVLIT